MCKSLVLGELVGRKVPEQIRGYALPALGGTRRMGSNNIQVCSVLARVSTAQYAQNAVRLQRIHDRSALTRKSQLAPGCGASNP